MALRKTREDREWDKFCADGNGDTAVRTCTEITGGSISVESTPAGLGTAFLITTMDVGDTATLVPATALSTRDSVSIQNFDNTETLYIGPTSSVTAGDAVGTTSGWDVGPNETINLDFKAAIPVYAIAPSGKTIRIKIFEAG